MIAAVETQLSTDDALAPPEVDEERLAGLEQDLADAAAALEAIEEITNSDLEPTARISAISGLVDTGRFDVPDVPEVSASEPSDLVGNGDLGALEKFEAVAEDESPLA